MLRFPRWKIVLVALIVALGVIYAAPNLFSKDQLADLPDWVPSSQIVLGLDLQGGSYLLLEVGTEELVNERLEALRGDIRDNLRGLDDPRVLFRVRRDGQNVLVTLTDPSDRERAMESISELASFVETSGFSALPEEDLVITEQGEDGIAVTYSEAARLSMSQAAVEQSIEIVRRRVDELGTTEPSIQRQGENRIVLEVPGLEDPERLKDLLGKTAVLSFHLVDRSMSAQQAAQTRPPAGTQVLPLANTEPAQHVLIERRALLSGENLIDAAASFDQQTNEPIVTFRLDSAGARRFGDVTTENVGQPFAIVLDGEVLSAPVIREPILGGSGQISGGFSVKEANDLAILLRSGALPAELRILEERTVGPGLGADSVRAGEIAAIIGFVAVIIYMGLSYGLFGWLANLALICNIVLIAAALSVLGATLTLPGIAGIVLTIGMAVDANVLIFERIREELRNAKTPLIAIENGYNRALGTILDANITTFIAAIILFQLGAGPVRGFAVTLAIGVITSVFTAFTLNRMFVSFWYQARRPAKLVL
ncbi:protein translocase subunit SecD [Tepidicaulis sp. LMO-SS28]|uniref:protein translocase subunit SecD n=1 Tax=Tepidicaulis sp. LMO-SS28 TaxID=3447455 RepID=UPI003EDE8312